MADYLTVYVITEAGEAEVAVEIINHGVFKTEYWSDTGYEFNMIREPELLVVEAYVGGEEVALTEAQVAKALDDAYEDYYERAMEGEYN